MQIVDNGSGALCYSMLHQQVKSICMPCWTDVRDKLLETIPQGDEDARLTAVEELLRQSRAVDAHDLAKVVQIFAQTTDAGPDQVFARKKIAAEVCHCLWLLHVHGNCFGHQGHLTFKRSLLTSEWALHCLGSNVEYFPSLAKLINIWRESGHGIYTIWQEFHGVADARSYARHGPQRCLVGPWGSAHEAEEFILTPPTADHIGVVSALLQHNERKKRKRAREEAGGLVDDLGAEEHEAYVLKFGRWGKEAKLAIDDERWWLVLKLLHRSRQPLAHFQHALMKYSKRVDPDNMRIDNVQCLATFVWGYGAKNRQHVFLATLQTSMGGSA